MRIFLIIFDTLRKDHTGQTYGNNWIKTPNFDEFAKDSLVFDKAYPESLPTLPVRRAIHTGIRTFPFNHERPKLRTDDVVESPGWFPIPPSQKHLSEYLKKWGYVSGFITSTYHQFKPNMNYHLGFDHWFWIRGHEGDPYRAGYRGSNKEFRTLVKKHVTGKDIASRFLQKHILDAYLKNVQGFKSEEDYFPAKTFKQAIEFVKDTISLKNTICVIDEFDPHEPWLPPQSYLDLYVDKNYTGKKAITPYYNDEADYMDKDELKYMRASYAGEVSLCDTWFGYFIEELKSLGIYNDSLIILISDHGHSIGEHNATGKLPQCLYPELVDIPFMIKPPGGLKGPKRIKKPYVYDHDILPTIFGFLGKRQEEVFNGIDLSIFIDEEDHEIENRDYITCGFALCTLYKDDNYALITNNDRSSQKLFDLSSDPEWNIDIAEEHPDICDRLFKKIEADAKGELCIDFESKLNELKDWYIQKSKDVPE